MPPKQAFEFPSQSSNQSGKSIQSSESTAATLDKPAMELQPKKFCPFDSSLPSSMESVKSDKSNGAPVSSGSSCSMGSVPSTRGQPMVSTNTSKSNASRGSLFTPSRASVVGSTLSANTNGNSIRHANSYASVGPVRTDAGGLAQHMPSTKSIPLKSKSSQSRGSQMMAVVSRHSSRPRMSINSSLQRIGSLHSWAKGQLSESSRRRSEANELRNKAGGRKSHSTSVMSNIVNAQSMRNHQLQRQGSSESAASAGFGAESSLCSVQSKGSKLRDTAASTFRSLKSQLEFSDDFPIEFMAQSIANVVSPRFVDELEATFKRNQEEIFLVKNFVDCVLRWLIIVVVICFDLVYQAVHDVQNEGLGLFPLISLIMLGVLLIIWVSICRNAVLLNRFFCIFMLCFTFFQCFETMSGMEDALARCMRILFVFAGFSAFPSPLPLVSMLFVLHASIVYWLVQVSLSLSIDTWEVVRYGAYFYGFILLLFLAARRQDIESRRMYLKDKMGQHLADHSDLKVAQLSKAVVQMGDITNVVHSEEFFETLRKAHHNRLIALKDDLENYSMKTAIQQTHDSLLHSYILFASTEQSDETSVAESVHELEMRFNGLKRLATKESSRLAKVMTELWQSYADLPEWTYVASCPSFMGVNNTENPKEKLKQTSCCDWWYKPYIDSITEKVGLEMDPLVWYDHRSRWARSDFIHILKRVVTTFNEANTASDLQLYPDIVMDWWNEKHPDLHMARSPFLEGCELSSEHFPMSKTMQHEYEVSGRNAGLQIGPQKERHRARTKVEEYEKEDPAKFPDRINLAKYVIDWLRSRVFFSNVNAMVVFYWYLMTQVEDLRVIAMKNKLVSPPEEDTSCSLHLNVRFDVQGEEHTAEVQLVLESFVVAKDLEHKYYQFRRANRLVEVLSPILDAPNPEDAERHKMDFDPSAPLLE